MTNFNPFLDLTKKKDEELYTDINELNKRISYYHQTGYLYVANQLSAWRDVYVDEIHLRMDKKRLAKEKAQDKTVVFDSFIEGGDEPESTKPIIEKT